MFKKLFGLFSLEERLANSVNQNFQLSQTSLQKQLDTFEKRLAAITQQFDKLSADLNYRLSRIEALLEDDLKAWEVS